jgi:hypothetical protein
MEPGKVVASFEKSSDALSKCPMFASRARSRSPQDRNHNEKQTENDEEGGENRARDAYVSELALRQTDKSSGYAGQTTKPECNPKATKRSPRRG